MVRRAPLLLVNSRGTDNGDVTVAGVGDSATVVISRV